jgi:4-hydroxy-tetrahydrodipicolinate synthase
MGSAEHHPRFGSLLTAMVTPFDHDGALDLDTAQALARYLVDRGTQGLVVAGTTGEGPTLSDEEKLALFRAVKEATAVPVLAGCGTNDTAHTVALARSAKAAGVDALLVVTPYYSRPSQEGLKRHFSAVAAATDLPLMLYDIPVRTGRAIALDTMVELARTVPTIVAVKDSTHDPVRAARLVARAPTSFELYCGDDDLVLPMLAVGAVGLVSVASHWAGRELAELLTATAKGDLAGARAVLARLLDSFDFESTEAFPNPLPAKAACRALGLAVGQCRDPLGPAPAALDAAARRVLEGLGVTVG